MLCTGIRWLLEEVLFWTPHQGRSRLPKEQLRVSPFRYTAAACHFQEAVRPSIRWAVSEQQPCSRRRSEKGQGRGTGSTRSRQRRHIGGRQLRNDSTLISKTCWHQQPHHQLGGHELCSWITMFYHHVLLPKHVLSPCFTTIYNLLWFLCRWIGQWAVKHNVKNLILYNAPLAIRYPPDIRPRPLPGLIFSNIRPGSVTNWISTCGLNRIATCSLRSAECHRVKPTANLVCVISEVTGAQLVTAAQHTLRRVGSL